MIITIIILAWLLANTWLSLIMCTADGGGCGETWFDLMCLAFASIVSPFVWLWVFIPIITKIQKMLDK